MHTVGSAANESPRLLNTLLENDIMINWSEALIFLQRNRQIFIHYYSTLYRIDCEYECMLFLCFDNFLNHQALPYELPYEPVCPPVGWSVMIF